MTRPKSVRQRAKGIGPLLEGPHAGLPIIMRTRHRVSPKYVVQITLFDGDGFFPISCSWFPAPPKAWELKMLDDRLAELSKPFLEAALQCAGMMESDLW